VKIPPNSAAEDLPGCASAQGCVVSSSILPQAAHSGQGKIPLKDELKVLQDAVKIKDCSGGKQGVL
jgi:hypothetical protein